MYSCTQPLQLSHDQENVVNKHGTEGPLQAIQVLHGKYRNSCLKLSPRSNTENPWTPQRGIEKMQCCYHWNCWGGFKAARGKRCIWIIMIMYRETQTAVSCLQRCQTKRAPAIWKKVNCMLITIFINHIQQWPNLDCQSQSCKFTINH